VNLLVAQAITGVDPVPISGQAILTIVISIAVLGALAWFLRRGAATRRSRLPVSVETAVPLGERRSLVIVSVEGRRLLLGLTPDSHIGHLLAGQKTLAEIVIRGPLGVEVVPASSGLQSITAMTSEQRSVLHHALQTLAARLDFLVIDTAAGISDNVVETLRLAERVALVTSLEPSAVVDAYATAKILTQTSPSTEIGVIVNSVRDGEEAALAFKQLDVAATRFLGRRLRYYGYVAEDRAVRDSVIVQRHTRV